MAFVVNGEDHYATAEEVVQALVTSDVVEDYYSDNFDEWVDENNGCFEVCGYQFSASDILQAMNNDAYYRERADWAENETEYFQESAMDGLQALRPYEVYDIMGNDVRFVPDEEEENERNEAAENNQIQALRAKMQQISDKEKQEQDTEAQRYQEFLQMLD